jgi:two-component system LytT family response regulator
MDKISTIIIDDEILSLQMQEEMLHKMDEVSLLKTFTKPKQALSYLIENPEIDLIFLDIRMPEMSGFDFLKELQQFPAINPSIVFITGFEEHAIEAIRAAAFDFLLKPIQQDELEQCLYRYKKKCQKEVFADKYKILFHRLDPAQKIVFNHHCGFVAYHPDDIFYITADGNYCYINLLNGSQQIVTMQIGQIEKLTSNLHFFRVNRSELINLKYFQSADQKEKACHLRFNGTDQIFETTAKKIREMQNILMKS